jgi:hypothetical protein
LHHRFDFLSIQSILKNQKVFQDSIDVLKSIWFFNSSDSSVGYKLVRFRTEDKVLFSVCVMFLVAYTINLFYLVPYINWSVLYRPSLKFEVKSCANPSGASYGTPLEDK